MSTQSFLVLVYFFWSEIGSLLVRYSMIFLFLFRSKCARIYKIRLIPSASSSSLLFHRSSLIWIIYYFFSRCYWRGASCFNSGSYNFVEISSRKKTICYSCKQLEEKKNIISMMHKVWARWSVLLLNDDNDVQLRENLVTFKLKYNKKRDRKKQKTSL